MKKLLIAIVVVVVVAVGALLALPVLISTDTVKAELIALIEEATGRQVRIDGPVSVSILPSAMLAAEGVGISGLTGDDEAFAVDSMSFGLSLLPLISGNVDLNAVTFIGPRILVAFDEQGRLNWVDAAAADATQPADSIEALIAGETAVPQVAAETADALAALRRLNLGTVKIVNGSLTYRDRAGGIEETLSDLNLTLDLPRIAGAGKLDGRFVWHEVEHALEVAVGERDVAAPLERIPLEIKLSQPGGALTASGTALDGDTFFAGRIDATGDSLRTFARGLGLDLPEAPGFAAFTLSADVAVDDARLAVERFSGDLGGTTFTGAVQAAYDRVRPGVGLRLSLGRLDTTMFAAPQRTGSDAAAVDPGGAGGADTIDFSALALVDVNAAIAAEAIQVGDVALTDLGIDLTLVAGVLSTTINSLKIDGAPGSGNLTVDASGATPRITGSANMSGLDLGGLLALAGQSAPVTGNAGLDVAFEASGASTAALMAGLEASGTVTLADGRLSGLDLADMVGGDAAANHIEDIDLTARFDSLASPVAANGGLTWRGERFTITGKVDPRALAEAGGSDVALEAASSRVNIGFNGRVGLDGVGSGNVSLSTPSLRNLLAWIGQPIDAGDGLAAFSINGAVALGADSFSFERANFTLDKSSGLGTGKVVFAGKPAVTAGLAMKVLDVTPYLVASGASGGKSSGGGGDGGGGGAGGAWSKAPIDFSGLTAIDANLNLKADSIIADRIKIGPSSLTIKLAGGRLDANLSEMALYSGTGTGSMVFDGTSATPTLSASFKLAGVNAQPLLTDAIGFNRIAGTGAFDFAVQASGASQDALVRSLSGNGAMAVRNGAVLGIDIPKMLQSLSIQTLLGWQPGNDKTEFDQIDATFAIAKGIVTNDDLVMAGPRFRLNGAGQIDIPAQTISYRVNPEVALQGGKKDKLEDFAVPVRIEGSWDKPRIYPEIEGILENPEAALKQLQQIGGGLFGGGKKGESQELWVKSVATQAVQGLIGGGAGDGTDGGQQDLSVEAVAGQAIQELIGSTSGSGETANDGADAGSGGEQQTPSVEALAGQALQGLLGGGDDDESGNKKKKKKNKNKNK